MAQDIILTIDVGTGSTRAGLVDINGKIIDFSQKEYDYLKKLDANFNELAQKLNNTLKQPMNQISFYL